MPPREQVRSAARMLVPLVGGALELRFDDESRLEKLALDGRGFPEDEIEIDGDTEQLVAMDALHTFVEGEKQESGRAENASELSHRLPQLCRIEADNAMHAKPALFRRRQLRSLVLGAASFATRPPRAAAEEDSLDEALALVSRRGPEFGGGLSNHGPMACEALIALGRPESALPF